MATKACIAALLFFHSLVFAAPLPIAEHVYLVPGNFAPGQQPDGNSVLIEGSSGWIVFDSGRHAAHAQQILDFVGKREGRIQAIVNSHWHLDHVGGNGLIRAAHADLRVYGSSAIEQAMGSWLANYRSQLNSMLEKDQSSAADRAKFSHDLALIDSGAALYPDVPIESTRNWIIAERRVRLGLQLDAVTGGDVWMYDRRSRLLIAGDLVTLPVPFFDTACPKRWSAALAGLEDLPFERLVPGHGPLLDRAQFRLYRLAFDALLQCASTEQPRETCAEQWIDAAGQWIVPSERSRAREMLLYYLDQHLRTSTRDTFCGEH